MRPMLSEFSYGYSLTEQLARIDDSSLIAAPLFPSLQQEGLSDVGYDVQIPYRVAPLFLQFKLSHLMKRRSAAEYGLFGFSFYRMHLRPLRLSSQHTALLNLEASGKQVYYAAPLFHTMEQLSEAYLERQVIQRSAFFPPSAIGEVSYEEEHHVAFTRKRAFVCSTPRQLSYDFSGANFLSRLKSAAKVADLKPDKTFFLELLDDMSKALGRHQPDFLSRLGDPNERNRMTSNEASHLTAFAARAAFDSEVFLVALKK